MRHSRGKDARQHSPLSSDADELLRPTRSTSAHRLGHSAGGPRRGQGRAPDLHPLRNRGRVGSCRILSPQRRRSALQGAPQPLEVASRQHALVRGGDLGRERGDVVSWGDGGQARHGRPSLVTGAISARRCQSPTDMVAAAPATHAAGAGANRNLDLFMLSLDYAAPQTTSVAKSLGPSPGSCRLDVSGRGFRGPDSVPIRRPRP